MCRSLLEHAGAGLQKRPCSLTSFVSEEKTNTQGAELLIQNNSNNSRIVLLRFVRLAGLCVNIFFFSDRVGGSLPLFPKHVASSD